MRLYLPPPLERFDQHNERDMRDALTRSMIPVISQDEAVPYFHISDAEGRVWKVTVSPTGFLQTEYVQGAASPPPSTSLPLPLTAGDLFAVQRGGVDYQMTAEQLQTSLSPWGRLTGTFGAVTPPVMPAVAPLVNWEFMEGVGSFAANIDKTTGEITLPRTGTYRVTTFVVGQQAGNTQGFDLILTMDLTQGVSRYFLGQVYVPQNEPDNWRAFSGSFLFNRPAGTKVKLGMTATKTSGLFTPAGASFEIELVTLLSGGPV